MANKVYTAAWYNTIAAGLAFVSNFSINSPGREIKVKSVALTWKITYTINGINLPVETATDQILTLIIGEVGIKNASCFHFTAGNPSFSGDTFQIYKPMQYFFDSFFISNNLRFSLQINNLNVLSDHDHFVNLIVETEENPIY